jgi:hypothetical protein
MSPLSRHTKAATVMNGHFAHISDPIDRRTSRSICDAVGERLQQNLLPHSQDPSPYLQQLLDQLREQDGENASRAR